MGERGHHELTEPQQAVYDYMVRHFAERQFWPSVAEISRHFGWASSAAADDHVRRIVAKGWLERPAGVARAYRIPGVRLRFAVVASSPDACSVVKT